jgi:hypothetical protein
LQILSVAKSLLHIYEVLSRYDTKEKKVDPNTGRITQYRAAVKIAFGVEHES